jgi:hypothetical protein
MGEMRILYSSFLENHKKKYYLRENYVIGSMMLKWILRGKGC